MDYNSALHALKKYNGIKEKRKRKRVAHETYLWAENPSTNNAWDEAVDGPLTCPPRIHVELFGNKIITWHADDEGRVELPSRNTSCTTLTRIRDYTGIRSWKRGEFTFLQHPAEGAPVLPYLAADFINTQGHLVGSSDSWLNAYDSYELYLRANRLAQRFASTVVYGKYFTGWEGEWTHRPWEEDDGAFRASSPDLVEALHNTTEQQELPMTTILSFMHHTRNLQDSQKFLLSCHPQVYARNWTRPRTRAEKAARAAAELTGKLPIKVANKVVVHPREHKEDLKTALLDGMLHTLRLT